MRVARVLVLLVVMATIITTGCVGSPFGEGLGCSTPTDAHEPNDEPQQATPLSPGETVEAVIAEGGSGGDLDIYACQVPETGFGPRFTVEIASSRARYLQVQVGASVPDAWEAISWPGWEPARQGDRIVVEGGLKGGTVLIFVSGDRRAEYSVRITWHE